MFVCKSIPMKITLFISIALFTLLACKKEKTTAGVYKVKYSVTGNSVNQFKISYGAVDNLVTVPFSGTKDTTIYQPAGTSIKLDTKADNNNLVGSIYVNDVLVASQTDTDNDGDGKTEVKLDYSIPVK